MKKIMAVLAVFVLSAVVATAALANGKDKTPKEPKKVYVCKYVGTPGVDERLQTGQNPIEVAISATGVGAYPASFPQTFADAHGKSVAIGYVGGEDVLGGPYPVLGIESCPAPEGPPDEECPEGTHDESGQCVPDEPPVDECPPGSHMGEDGQCVSDEPPIECPPGEHDHGGVCEPGHNLTPPSKSPPVVPIAPDEAPVEDELPRTL